ncbi:UTP--glucose-1-phosphate uridylyltransferase GalU [Caulobacter sp. RHG1]|uniref:UTP--glucose-1-phosphate uridylyltransferase GalU n=1 Tax=Caulobacter sp. (strain RHG1) TaxID=2545762 RepID=UPI00155805F1|nr:UTP--glucose-1-phosphate uridylyltransferase GalU [Caulobacter sp. RHG1]NQE62354.1 UTP--glucose-1-phosphate uridylyltransferase [Caulobacter sp. RHG1]
MKPVRKAVLPVAGLGTRVLPGTKTTPKELLNVVDRPILSYIVEEGRKAGIEHFVFVTGRGKGAIEDYFDHQVELEAQLEAKGKTDILEQLRAELPKPGEMSFVRQMAPLGLGHAVWCARDIIGDEPFAVMLPDVIVDADPSALGQLIEVYDKVGGGNVIGVEEVPMEDTHKYGIVAPSKIDGRLATMSGMVEKPAKGTAPSNLSIAGRYILQPEIFDLLASQEKGAGNEIQLTDSMAKLMTQQQFHAYVYEGVTHDCGDKIGLLRANVALALKRSDLGAAARAAVEAALKA